MLEFVQIALEKWEAYDMHYTWEQEEFNGPCQGMSKLSPTYQKFLQALADLIVWRALAWNLAPSHILLLSTFSSRAEDEVRGTSTLQGEGIGFIFKEFVSLL